MEHRWLDKVGNLIIINNLQMARERVSQVDTVWIMRLKLL